MNTSTVQQFQDARENLALLWNAIVGGDITPDDDEIREELERALHKLQFKKAVQDMLLDEEVQKSQDLIALGLKSSRLGARIQAEDLRSYLLAKGPGARSLQVLQGDNYRLRKALGL